jgi:hypothetical protein
VVNGTIKDITFLELFPLVVSLHLGWFPSKQNNHIQCWQPVSCSYYKQEIVQVDKSNVPGQKSCFANIEI